jgi:hypothetical protein
MHPVGGGLKLNVQYVELFPVGYSEYLSPATPSPVVDFSMHRDQRLGTGDWTLVRDHVYVVAKSRQSVAYLLREVAHATLIRWILASDQPYPHTVS